MSAAKWHREQAANHADDAASAERNVRRNDGAEWAENCARAIVRHQTLAAHYATAADALEALAVPGVAGLLDTVTRLAFVTDARDGDRFVNEDQRAALSRLAKIASEGK